ncbi:hypothetical protein [Halopenitus sp. POP-27]|uniref:DUF7266 family protein n=1 Tax=Halopenitus sp. POP-27 TaxID=2994425 RepID=UPI002468C32F|nr:hypothetical protein [Halopenitus sp. POP-27]
MRPDRIRGGARHAHGRTDARLTADDRGVSTVVGYVLGLIIASLLVSGLFIAGGDLLTNQQETTTRTGIEVAGDRIATGYADADRLVESGSVASDSPPTVAVAVPVRSRIANDGYVVTVDGGGGGDPPYTTTITLENTGGSVTHTVRVRTHTPVVDESVTSGRMVIRYVDGVGLRIESGRLG